MEELLELRRYVQEHRYAEALDLIADMEEMSKEDKVNKIRSFAAILLLHLVKQEAEKRTTRSWDISVRNAIREIHYTNQRRKAQGTYLTEDEMRGVIGEAYPMALDRASLEAFEGRYDERELGHMVDRAAIQQKAYDLIAGFQSEHSKN